MKNHNFGRGMNPFRWLLWVALLGALTLTGCIVDPGGDRGGDHGGDRGWDHGGGHGEDDHH